MASRASHPHPWLFALSGMPYGVMGSFVAQVMPYLTSKAGIKLDSIGWFTTLLFIPTVTQFLYAPVVDVGPKRKHWLVIVSVIGAAFLVAACVMPLPDHVVAFLVLAFLAQTISGLVGSCNGGLLAVSMPDHLRGRASGALNIGNLSGGALSAAVAIWMTGRVPPLVIGLTLAFMMIAPSLAILFVIEPPRDNIRSVREVFGTTLHDVWDVLSSRSGLTGILLCLSPVGTAALTNYFSGMTGDYGASDTLAAIVNGPANAILTAVGALVGGYLCDRYNRRVMYLLSGLLTALCGLAMVVSPRSDITYAWGAMLYLLITGFCFSAFTATVLESIGKAGKAASTQYTLFTAAGNGAIAWVGLVDTRFYDHHGVNGVIGSDASLNILGVVVLSIVFWKLGAFGKWRHDRDAKPETGAAS